MWPKYSVLLSTYRLCFSIPNLISPFHTQQQHTIILIILLAHSPPLFHTSHFQSIYHYVYLHTTRNHTNFYHNSNLAFPTIWNECRGARISYETPGFMVRILMEMQWLDILNMYSGSPPLSIKLKFIPWILNSFSPTRINRKEGAFVDSRWFSRVGMVVCFHLLNNMVSSVCSS